MRLPHPYRNWIGPALKAAILVLALAFIGDRSRALQALDWTVGDAGANLAMVFAFWTSILAPGFYLSAIWDLSGVFRHAGQAGAFGPVFVRSVRGAGRCLAIGAACGLAVAPLAARLLTGQAPVSPLSAWMIDLTFGLIGLSLFMLAASGQKLRNELEQYV